MSTQHSFPKPTYGSAGSPAKTLAWPDAARAWLARDLASSSRGTDFLEAVSQDGLLSKMSPVCSAPMAGETLRSCWAGLPDDFQQFLRGAGQTPDLRAEARAATTSRGVCWTLCTSEYPSAAVVSSLSQIVETDVAPMYFLSARAAAGILQRTSRRGHPMPACLRRALEAHAMAT